MVQKLEAVKGGGGSTRPSPRASASVQAKPGTILVSVPCSATTPRKLQARKSLDEASSSGQNRRSPETRQKMKSFNKSTHHIPMFGSDSIILDRTPSREKSDKKATKIVEITWANPITSKLKKLGFSKLPESNV
ncbi:hypothetical protein NC652_028330 [Populus alba x Populus x berolinensis]|nr:hypothetical protein NC652_028330 [Populus alba x Populus x berolinensis]